MEKVSIIIPIYNEEAYIRQSLKSVMRQTYKKLEIIVINDGSTDQSLHICNELSQNDERIFVFSQINTGVSTARNRGIDIATGEYIFFLDGDDAIHPFLIEHLVCQMKKHNVELAMCECRKMTNQQMESIIYGISKSEEEKKIWTRGQAEEWFHKYPKRLSGIGGKMILRKFIGDLRFERQMIYGEDTLFLYNLICKNPRVAYFNVEWYFYRQHLCSVTHSEKVKMDEKYFECTKIIRKSEYEKNQMPYVLYWEEWLLEQMEKSFVLMKESNKKKKWKELRKMAVAERKHPLFYKLNLCRRLRFWICFFAYPLYKNYYNE